jgi:hypothetical protein
MMRRWRFPPDAPLRPSRGAYTLHLGFKYAIGFEYAIFRMKDPSFEDS